MKKPNQPFRLRLTRPNRAYTSLIFGGLLLALLLIAGSWFLVVILKNHELMRYFLWDEIILRIFTPYHARHSSWYAAFYIFLPVLVFGTFPWWYYAGKGSVQTVKTANVQYRGEL